MKKVLLIIGILAVIGVAAFLIFNAGPEREGQSRVGFSITDYLPFGSSDSDSEPGDNFVPNDGDGDVFAPQDKAVAKLRKISSEPVAGSAIWSVGTTSLVRFVEKGTGNVYEVRSDSNFVERLTNTTIPKIIRAFWLPDGSGFLAQTLLPESEVIETSFVKLNKNTGATTTESLTPYSTTISKLPTGIREIAVSPNGSKIFYYTIEGSRSSWFTANPDGTGETKVYTHFLTEWLPVWVSTNIVEMQTKPSYAAVSRLYSFNLQSKSLGNTSRDLSIFPNTPNTDKCVRSEEETDVAFCAIPKRLPTSLYPDDWYKGLVSTNDYIEKIDLANDIHYQISDLSIVSGEEIDVLDITLSPNEHHLTFRNKTDGYLWLLEIEE